MVVASPPAETPAKKSLTVPLIEPSLELRLMLRMRTRDEFTRWLQNGDRNRFVGERGNPFRCPIRNWLKEAFFEYGRVAVGTQTFSYSTHRWLPFIGFSTLVLPVWARRFVSLVDDSKFDNHITAADALWVLKYV